MTVNLQKHLELLGMRVVDRVTGMKGVVASVTFGHQRRWRPAARVQPELKA